MKSTEINAGTYENELGGVSGHPPRTKPEPPPQPFAPPPRRLLGWVIAALIAVVSAAIAFQVGTKIGQPAKPTAGGGQAASVMSVSVESAAIKPVHKTIDVTG